MKIILTITLLLTHALFARSFFAFDNGLTDLKSPEKQAALLAELGYDGLVGRVGNHARMLKALDQRGLKLGATYLVLNANATSCPVPDKVVSELKALKGRETKVWLAVNGRSTDEIVVPSIRKVCDLGAELGLEVVLYPHTNFHTDTVASCLRLLRQVERKNLGVSFNLCHFLKQSDPADLEKTIRAAAPHLKLVSINGADTGDTRAMGWDRLIRPLGEGSFEVSQMLKLLDEIGYRGPVGLQCYAIKQPATVHLAKSMDAWRRLTGDSQATVPAKVPELPLPWPSDIAPRPRLPSEAASTTRSRPASP
ncbi:sugar phosphate isomerase/epimerase family protein [Haloferula sp. A504]|uniref:sugar phosphate isomerase/epimerase family protein n=1 Tax=Haloferula sp. A504 TaxID=3373601 RepID=UPI0031C1E0B9|nr:sugar phosphate isomerase/epimerase [Verrucomicrobiaceae bacterium E54]